MRKVKDHYYKKAKQEKYPARSVYKLEEAQKKYRFIRKNDKILDLGCYPGSWSLLAAAVSGPHGLVVGIDLQELRPQNRDGSAWIHHITEDISSEDAHEGIREIAPQYDVLLSDMAPKTSGHKFSDHMKSIDLAGKALTMAEEFLRKGGSFYCKVFQGEDFPLYVKQVRSCFKKIHLVKPQSSRSESREVFVLGLGFKG